MTTILRVEVLRLVITIRFRHTPADFMSTYRLDRLFDPRSVVLVGASSRSTSVGRVVLRNLRDAGFGNAIYLVNPHYAEIDGIAAVKSVADLPLAPDLVIVAAPPPAVPEIIAAAGAKGCSAAIIVTAGLGHGSGSLGRGDWMRGTSPTVSGSWGRIALASWCRRSS